MQKIVNCKLVIKSYIGKENDVSTITGKGYYKKDDNKIIVYFSSDNNKYKYEYDGNLLVIYSNDSKYYFEKNKKHFGEIKSGEYTFSVTTLTNKFEINDNSIVLDYSLIQNNQVLGKYETSLIF